jgi:hypothetical protein
MLQKQENVDSESYWYGLKWCAQHGNKHVDEHDDHYPTVGAKHQFADKLCEFVVLLQFKMLDLHKSIDGKVQSLQDFKQTAKQDLV